MSLDVTMVRQIGDFDLSIQLQSEAKRIGILGASGSGKSMTLKAIAGIEPLDSGRIVVNGRVLYDHQAKISLKPQIRHVGYMFQNYALFPRMNVLQNVMAGLKGNREENRLEAMAMLKRVHMEGYEDHLPSELSGGQQQRVALARIMVTRPELILLDEPFAALDGYLRDQMQVEMMAMLRDYQGQIIMVSHNRDELYRFAEELFVIDKGRIITSGETKVLFQSPGVMEAARLTGCKNIVPVKVIDEHTLYVMPWDLTLTLQQEVSSEIRWIGYRAHAFIPVWGERKDHCIPFDLVRIDRLPFEENYYIRAQDGEHLICWFVQENMQRIMKERGLPDYLQLDEEHLLLLK